MTVGMYCIQMV